MGASMSMQDIHAKVNEAAIVGNNVGVDVDVDVELVEVDVAVPLPSTCPTKSNGSKGLCSYFSERTTRTYC
jgi:hypothetical protein